MQISIVNLSECAKYDFGHFLFSPDFFLQDKLQCWSLIENQSNGRVIDYFTHIKKTVKEINTNSICYDLTHALPKFFDEGENVNTIGSVKKIAKGGDFAISRLRSYLEEMGIIERRDLTQLFSTEFLIFRGKTKNISTASLFALCMTKEVQTILKRSQYGTEHPRFFDFLLENLPIPKCLISMDKNINVCVNKALGIRRKSISAYQQAQTILLAELGLAKWHSTHKLTFVKNYSDTKKTGRIDAEYYQPKYDELVKVIQNYPGGYDTLGNQCKTKRGSLISENFYSDNLGDIYIRGADFSGGVLSKKKSICIDNNFLRKNEITVKTGEMVFSLIGSVGETALVTEEFSGSFISNNTGKITCTKNINPTTLQVMLHSIIGKMYFEKYKTQTAQPKISDKDIHHFVLPILTESVQNKIQQKINKFFLLREQSKRLLECTKQAVEMAIEHGENKATTWLEKQTKELTNDI